MTSEEAIKELNIIATELVGYLARGGLRAAYLEDRLTAVDMAIDALDRRVPKMVKIEPWSEAECPRCGYSLSEHKGDGWYTHKRFLNVCPNEECLQRLKWESEDER